MAEDEFYIGPRPEKYLNLRPQNTYGENIEALDSLIDGEYGEVSETYEDLNPRLFHKTFSGFYEQEHGPAQVDAEALEDVQKILSNKSEKDHFWLEDKLFKLGYELGPKEDSRRTRRSRRRERNTINIAHGQDMMPDLGFPVLRSPVRKGRLKREADDFYNEASRIINLDIGEFDIEIV
jgi:hypothetical protein